MPDFSTLQDQVALVKAKIDALVSSALTAEEILYVSETLQTLANTLGVDDIIAATADAIAQIQQAGEDTIAVVEGTANGEVVVALSQAYTDLDNLYNNLAPRVTSIETSLNAQESAILTATALSLKAALNDWEIVTTNTLLTHRDRVLVVPSQGLTLTLPPGPQLGDMIEIVDAAGTAGTTNFTIERSLEKIQGLEENLIFNVNSQAIKLVYAGSDYGWRIL